MKVVKSTAEYPMGEDLTNKMIANGFTSDKLADLQKKGLYRDTIKTLVLGDDLKAKQVDKMVKDWKDSDSSKNLGQYVFVETKKPSEARSFQKNQEINTILFDVGLESSGTLQQEVIRYVMGSKLNANDVMNGIVYLDRDLHIAGNDPLEMIAINTRHRNEVKNIASSFEKDTGLNTQEYLRKLGCFNKMTNQSIDDTRCALKLVTWDLMQKVEEKLKSPERQLVDKYSPLKVTENKLNKEPKSTKKPKAQLEYA